MALIQQVASSSFPEKSEGRAVFSSAVCEDMGGGAGITRGGFPRVGSEGVSVGEDGKG